MKKKIAIFYGDKQNVGDYDNGVWMDLLGIPFLSNIEQARDYDIIIRTLWLEQIGWSALLRQKFPHLIQIGLSDHPLSTHISKLSADKQYLYLKDLEKLDGLLALTEEERQFYQIALPSKPVIKAGLPFPFESYEARYGTLRGSEKKYIGLGVGAGDNDRNFISNLLVFERLRLSNPDIQGVFLSIPQQLFPYCSFLASKYQNIWIQQRTTMGDFYDTLSQCKFVLNLADRNTPGRLQGEGAFFGVPVIGSNRFELQNELFPDIAVTPYELERATAYGQQLLDTPELGKVLTDKAYKGLEKYNYASSKRKFNKLLNQISGG